MGEWETQGTDICCTKMLPVDPREERFFRRETCPVFLCMLSLKVFEAVKSVSPSSSTKSKTSGRLTKTDSSASSATSLVMTSKRERNWE
jgi:hypothetical protein